ncbi:MAG TPA: Hsp70 family protein [Anaerolineales bacterium]|nr:Hsp70 family protein [Anaerolineales bacterium]
MGYKLAIDFGMTNSVIAQWDEASASSRTLDVPPLSVSTSAGAFLIPTLLYVCNGQTGEMVIGQAVRVQGLDHQMDNRLFRNFKRTLQTEAVFDARLIDGVPWTEAQAGQIFLRRLLDALPYRAEDIDQLAITVPVAALEEYAAWLSRAVDGIPAEKIRIVDESTAAALGYAITEPNATVLVIDFGGGTLDLSLVRLPENREKTGKRLSVKTNGISSGKAQVIAKAGVSLGGADIDQWLLQEVLRRENLLPESLGAGYSTLLSACEQAKIALSTMRETTLQFLNDAGKQISISLTRTELESLLRQNGLFAALQRALEKVMGLAAQKGVYREDIQHVLMVGGTALIPSIQQTLDEYFRAITQRQRKAIMQMPTWPATTWKIDNTSIRVDKPFTAVVEGALQAAIGFHLDDQLAHGYGLRYLDSAGVHYFDEIIPMGSPYPSKTSVSVTLGASYPGQKVMEFMIGQINTDALSSTEMNFAGGQRALITQAGANTQ